MTMPGVATSDPLRGPDAPERDPKGDPLSETTRENESAKWRAVTRLGFLQRARRALLWLGIGLLFGAWAGGGTDRYGEDESMMGGVKGACGTIARGYRYAVASIRECVTNDRSSVRSLGLVRQIENRLWQDKRVAAEGIVVKIEEDGKAILIGQVPDAANKDRAVALTRDTRGVESVIDQLAVGSATRTIDAISSEPVPTGVTSGTRVVR